MDRRAANAEPKRVIVLQHAESENLGTIESALHAESVEFQYCRSFAGQPIPKAPEAFCALIVMGGPMGVYETERYPFLISEMNLIGHFLTAEKPILGVCLGSQLLAAALGADVRKGKQKEIGWYPVQLSQEGQRDLLWKEQPQRFTAFHWHGDVFDLPKGAVSLASSEITPVQAYRYSERAYGFLFHTEVSEGHLRRMLTEFAGEIREEELSAQEIVQQAQSFLPPLEKIAGDVFGHWAKLI